MPGRVKYDVRGVEAGQRAVLPAGVWVGKITGADVTKPEGKDERIELVVTVSENGTDYKLYEYVNVESEAARWKLRELLEAVGLVDGKKGESGVLDTNKMLMGKKIGVKTFIRPADDARGFDEQARIRRMFRADEVSGDTDEDLDEDLEAEEEPEGEETPYDDMSLADLRKEARGRGIKTVRLSAEEITQLLVEDDEAQETEPEAEAEEEEPEDEYDDMPLGRLRKLAKDRGISTVRKDKAKLIDALRELDEQEAEEPEAEEEEPEEEEPEAEESAEEPDDDYDEWELDDLRQELKDRSLATKGGKRALIMRLRRDDSEGDEPF